MKLRNILLIGGAGLALATAIPKETEQSDSPQLRNLEPAHTSEERLSFQQRAKITPKNVNHLDTLILAQAIYGEARGELDNDTYIGGVVSTIVNRAKTGLGIRRTLLEKTIHPDKVVYHYSCFDPSDPNYRVISSLHPPRNPNQENIWNRCYLTAKQVLEGRLEVDTSLANATHFFVGHDPRKNTTKNQASRRGIPGWAYEMTKDGKFILDENKERVPKTPLLVVDLKENRKAFFYSLNN
ncbi:MAG: cell wall hydrolase [Nanoarchaeota archaeon]|nr:cell wall hydrolase [Nanoarchaeota archaeon]